MNLKNSALAAAVTAALAVGAASPASAFIYGAAGLTISNLTITIGSAIPTVTGFTFNLSNAATLNGLSTLNTAQCSGTVVPLANNCSVVAGPIGRNAAVSNAPGSTILRTEDQMTGGEFTFLGTVAGANYANADSIITTAELVNGTPTVTHNIAESLLNSANSAQGTSGISSTTGITLQILIPEGGTFRLAFDADPDLIAQISGENPANTFSALASLLTNAQLTQTSGGAFVSWSPQGDAANSCAAVGLIAGGTCAEIADTQDLNVTPSTSTNNTTETSSFDPNVLNLTHFEIFVTGLPGGTYSLALREDKTNALTRTVAVPEPGILALMGMGLVGLFATSRRRKLG